MNQPELIIVGGGVAGAAAALRAAQYHLPAVWVQGDKKTHKASRAAWVKNIDNMLGIHPGIMQSKVVDLLRKSHPEAAAEVENGHFHISTTDLVRNAEERIRAEFADFVEFAPEKAEHATRTETGFRVDLSSGTVLEAPHLILATGVMDKQPVVHKERKGRVLPSIHWVFPYANQETLLYCIRCEGHLTVGQRVAVVGAGPAAAGIAAMIHERYGSEVKLLTAGEDPHWSETQAAKLAEYGITVHGGAFKDVEGGERGAALYGFVLEDGSRVETDFALVAMGLHRVYNDLARELGASLEGGEAPLDAQHVLIDARGETDVPGLFAVGDMASRVGEPVMKQVYTSQEYAVRAVDRVDARRRRTGREARSGA